jgi:YD repeat-containing protein
VTIGAQLAAALRRVLKFGYDNEDRNVSETDALGNVTTYGYDAAGNLAAVTDANSHTTNFEYDRNNRLLKEIRETITDSAIRGHPLHGAARVGPERQRGQDHRRERQRDAHRVRPRRTGWCWSPTATASRRYSPTTAGQQDADRGWASRPT